MELLQNTSFTWLLYLVSVLLTSFLFIYLNNEKKLKKLRRIGSLIPGPKPFPFVGNSLCFVLHSGEISTILYGYAKQFGSRYRLWIGKKLFVVISNPDDVEDVMRSYKFLNKGEDFQEIFGRIFGNGTFTADGAPWKKSRKNNQYPLKINVLKNYIDIMNSETKKIIKKLEFLAISNQTFDILNYIEIVTINIIGKALFDFEEDVDESEIPSFVQKTGGYFDDCFRLIFQPKLIRKMKQTLSMKKFQETVEGMSFLYKKVIVGRKLVRKIMSDDEGNDKMNKKFIEYLQDENFSEKDKKDEIITYSVGGTETSSVTMSFTFLILAIHQEIQEKVYEELHGIFGSSDRDATEDDLTKMIYLEQVLKEVMRHYPLVPFLFRTAKESAALGELSVPAETTIVINVFALHNDPRYFPEPETFNPEHFSIENCKNLSKGCYLPFSAGPRNCIGKAFAMYELKAVCSAILRKYRIYTTMKKENIKLKRSFILSSADGYPVSISKRN